MVRNKWCRFPMNVKTQCCGDCKCMEKRYNKNEMN